MRRLLKWSALVLSVCIYSVSCKPVPRRELTSDEKVADLYWIYSIFKENYAPLEYKEKLHNFSFDQLKAEYVEKAKQTKNNEEFYRLMHQFVSTFRDAHTSSHLTASYLPGRAKVAYLGFRGVRKGDDFLVQSFLPSFESAGTSNFPIQTGDLIKKVNGQSLPDYINTYLLGRHDLGQSESNTTSLMNSIFSRLSLYFELPQDDEITLTVERFSLETMGTLTMDITIPWVKKDYMEFLEEQDRVLASKVEKYTKALKTGLLKDDAKARSKITSLTDELKLYRVFENIANGNFDKLPPKVKGFLNSTFNHQRESSFQFLDLHNPLESRFLASLMQPDQARVGMEKLKQARNVPAGIIEVPGSSIYPAYVKTEENADKNKVLVGYIYLDTFSPAATSSEALDEFTRTVNSMQTLGVKSIVIDMINNGGGSLVLGIKMAQALSNKSIVRPMIQFKTNDAWLDEFQEMKDSMNSVDSRREIFRRTYENLLEDRQKGLLLSRPMSTDVLMPLSLKPNLVLKSKLNIVLLVNETCASMCDIFTAVLKDNQLATVLGTKTMGAGGNVNIHFSAPNSNLLLQQTESLIIRPNGEYLENNGVTPDIEIKTYEQIDTKYQDAVQQGLQYFLTNS